LWKEDGEIEFFLQQNSTANTTISSYGCVNSIFVNAKSLQTIIKENNISHIDFIKFDIEGSEFEVVNDEFIKTAYPIIDNWFFELHPHVCPNYEEKKENILSLVLLMI
jgi:FkbM family methyltransferase